jgi:ELWxxDGT repeat protein
MSIRSLVTLALGLFTVTAAAQQPYLVKDLNTRLSFETQSSTPMHFFQAGNTLYFSANRQLYKSDANGVSLVKVLFGPGSDPSSFSDLGNGVVLFSAFDGVNGYELWRTDGTADGTWLVKDIRPGGTDFLTQSSFYVPGIVVGGKLLFSANDGTNGRELWITDGTTDGTQLLVDLVAGPNSSSPHTFRRIGDWTYFFATNGLWKTDGTAAGTTLIKALTTPFTPVFTNGVFYFGAHDPEHGYELWRSDLTEAGTRMVADLRPGVEWAFTNTTVRLAPLDNGQVIFVADNGVSGRAIWRSDGTAAGTTFLKAEPFLGSNAPFLVSVGSYVAWASSASGGVWRTDGTVAGTTQLTNATDAFALFAFDSKLMFVSSGTYWTSDGTAAGTQPMTGVRVGDSSGTWVTGGKLYFGGKTDLTGTEPWVCDRAVAADCRMLANISPDAPPSASPHALVAAGGLVFFYAADGTVSGLKVWRTNGTEAGTFSVLELGGQSSPSKETAHGGAFYFQEGQNHLWRSDGSIAGTAKLRTFGSGQTINATFSASNYLFLTAADQYSNDTLWRTDGTPQGTISLRDPATEHPYFQLRNPWGYAELAGRTYFLSGGPALWSTDGTVAGTQPVVAVSPKTGLTAAGGSLYFGAGSQSTNRLELWKSDGTADGTVFVKLISDSPSWSLQQFKAAGPLLFFVLNKIAGGRELWRSDGTADGTFLLKSVAGGHNDSAFESLTTAGTTLFFVTGDASLGRELWKSDGTVAGTVMVTDIHPGAASSSPTGLTEADGVLWFGADDGVHGRELWKSDGTSAGTVLVSDLLPGPGTSDPFQITQSGRLLYFAATTDLGRELWALPLDPSAFSISDVRVVEGGAVASIASFTVTRSGNTAGAASVAYATANLTATAGSDYSTTTGTLSFAPGETSKSLDVTILGDTTLETNESFFMILSSPSGASIVRSHGTAVIEEDDHSADLGVEIVQAASSSTGNRVVRITNHGPSSASNITFRFTESPVVLRATTSGVPCSTGIPAVCSVGGTLAAGASRIFHLHLEKSWDTYTYTAPNAPPGRTVTVSASAAQRDTNPANDVASRMVLRSDALSIPPFLVTGQSATATMMLPFTASQNMEFRLTSSNANITVSPDRVMFLAGQTTGTFNLTAGSQPGTSILTLPDSPWHGTESMVVPVVAPGTLPKLDVAIVAEPPTVPYRAPAPIEVRIAAARHDGTLPTGLVTLSDVNGTVLAQQALSGGTTTFTRNGLAPGGHHFRVAYAGDANFNPLAGAPVVVNVDGFDTTTDLLMPPLICGSANIQVFVQNEDAADVPEGVVQLKIQNVVVATLPLVATGVPGQARAQITRAFDTSGYASAEFLPAASYFRWSSDGFHYTAQSCTPMSVVATAASFSSVAVTWTPNGAHHYEVLRYGTGGGGPEIRGSTTASSFLDVNVSSHVAYLYTVRAVDAGGNTIAHSTPDLATVIVFGDDPIVAGSTRVKLFHLTQLQQAVAAVHVLANVKSFGFPPVADRAIVRASHLSELRSILANARSILGLPAVAFTDPIAPGAPIRASHVNELRAGVK